MKIALEIGLAYYHIQGYFSPKFPFLQLPNCTSCFIGLACH